MDNRAVAALLNEMADLLDLEGRDRFRSRAFRRMSRVLESTTEPIAELLKYGRLERTPGFGEGGVRRMKEILRTGTLAELEALRGRMPPAVRQLLAVDGMGARTAKEVYLRLGVGSLEQLERVALDGGLVRVVGLSEAQQARVLRGIAAWRREQAAGRMTLAQALARGGAMVAALADEPSVRRVELTGSARRGKETTSDLDVLVASEHGAAAVGCFVGLPMVAEIVTRGSGRATVRIDSGHQADVRVVPVANWGAALHYFTGSKLHNIAVRARANRLGLHLSDHGISRRSDEQRLATGESEEEVFAAVGLPWIAPELRENTGEIEAAEAGRLPSLVEARALRGDAHAHLGAEPRALVETARVRGLRWIALVAPVAEAHARRDAVRALGERCGVRVLVGAEVDLGPGGLTVDGDALAGLDWVVARDVAAAGESAGERAARLVAALETGRVDVLAHPLGRRLTERGSPSLDVEVLLRAAARLEVAIELNCDPDRLDLDATGCRRAREVGAPIALGSDARAAGDLDHLALGVTTARRGWLEARHVLNTRDSDDVEAWRRARRRTHGVVVAVPMPIVPREIDKIDDDVAVLVAALAVERLAPELAARIERWFRDGNDAPLEAALGRLGGNPMQKAFELLARR